MKRTSLSRCAWSTDDNPASFTPNAQGDGKTRAVEVAGPGDAGPRLHPHRGAAIHREACPSPWWKSRPSRPSLQPTCTCRTSAATARPDCWCRCAMRCFWPTPWNAWPATRPAQRMSRAARATVESSSRRDHRPRNAGALRGRCWRTRGRRIARQPVRPSGPGFSSLTPLSLAGDRKHLTSYAATSRISRTVLDRLPVLGTSSASRTARQIDKARAISGATDEGSITMSPENRSRQAADVSSKSTVRITVRRGALELEVQTCCRCLPQAGFGAEALLFDIHMIGIQVRTTLGAATLDQSSRGRRY